MGKEYSILQMVISTKATIKTAILMVTASIHGKMLLHTGEISLKVLDKEQAYGPIKLGINTKGNLKGIRKMVWEHSLGLMEIPIKVDSWMT